MTIEEFRKISVMFHNNLSYQMTQLNNIALGRNEITDKEILEKIKMVNLEKFINEIEEKLDYICGPNGRKLSGGQKQKIALIWALVGNPKILIFNDPTANLDQENKKIINNIINFII